MTDLNDFTEEAEDQEDLTNDVTDDTYYDTLT